MRFASVLALLSLFCLPVTAQDGPPPEIRAVIDALVNAVADSGTRSVDRFLDDHTDPDYVTGQGTEALHELFGQIRTSAAGADDIGVERVAGGLKVVFGSRSTETAVFLAMSFEAPFRTTEIRLESDAPEPPMGQPEALEEAYGVRARGLEDMTSRQGDEAIWQFLTNHVAPETHADSLYSVLEEVRRIGSAAGGIMVSARPGVVTVGFRGPRSADVDLALATDPPYKVVSVSILPVSDEPQSSVPPLAWDDADRQLEGFVGDGFSGSVLLYRDGAVVLEKGYGVADPESGRPVLSDTQFDIGSTPIDFTRGALLLLAQEGQLALDDPITRFFSDVPRDKRSMTLRHLMTAASGLPNFHHLPEDADYDLTWISRDEAVRRILNQPLLFSPGEGDSHSHSAWVLLAAVSELASGMSLEEYLEQRFFGPAGMTRTGPYGPNPGFDVSDQAAGYGNVEVGEPNVPLNWGRTSWLIKGSGGMVSTPGDLLRWHQFLRSGRVLTGRYLALVPERGVHLGDSDRGFLNVVAFDPDQVLILCSNSMGRQGDASWRVGQALIGLARGN